MQFDLAILGGGPAGASAAVYAARKRLRTILITSEFGGQSAVSETIYNWIGTPTISGQDLAKNLKEHVYSYKGDLLTIVEGSMITSLVEDATTGFAITTDNHETYTAKSVLITTGSGRRKLEVPGAVEYENKGITYCASCDGPLFADMDVVVVGGGNAAFETSAQLLAYCKSVTLLHRSEDYRADEITVEKVLANPKMKALKNVEIISITGEQFVTTITFRDKHTQKETALPTSGIFVEIGQIPNTEFASTIVHLDQNKKIVVDPMNGRTSKDGIWSAGDATNGLYHQNNIAAGDAVKALEDIYIWLHNKH